jgi:coenzyme PQQ precursor peptide PqqA
VSDFAVRYKNPCQLGGQKFRWRTLPSELTLWQGGVRPDYFSRRAKMAWKTPKIVEVSVGMEINMYACAARK